MGEFVVRMLELKNVGKSFGDVRVLNGVNLSLEKGFAYTLKGGNGSGKTTLINIISGFCNLIKITENEQISQYYDLEIAKGIQKYKRRFEYA
jgi:ABC-type multidrug transport system ATPase subunit